MSKSIMFQLIFLLASAVTFSSASEVVTLNGQGQVSGTIKYSRSGKLYHAFQGIPYTNPPERFKDPEGPPPSWEGVRDGSRAGSPCLQLSLTSQNGSTQGSEDCLFINVFTPNLNPLKPLSTIVFIHGGAFSYGWGSQYGEEYFMDHDIILVNFNYRLGALGFLATEDGWAPGNFALKDQVEALKWVHEQIIDFGGDPDEVTLFGGSAGAAAVNYHLLSEESSGLFQRAISGSGSVDCPWAYIKNPRKRAFDLGLKVNCTSENTKELVSCLREKDASQLMNQSFAGEGWPLDPVAYFAPSKEVRGPKGRIFLEGDPTNLEPVSKVPWLTGVTSNEGLSLHAASVSNSPELLKVLNERWLDIAPLTFLYDDVVPQEDLDRVSRKLKFYYFGSKDISKDQEKSLEFMYSDRGFFSGVRRSAVRFAAANAPVYLYSFDYKGSTKSWLESLYGYNVSGIAHGDDFGNYFKFKMSMEGDEKAPNMEMPESDLEISRRLIRMIVSFARSGVPELWEDVPWPKLEVKDEPPRWMHLKAQPEMKDEDQELTFRLKFWENTLKGSSPSAGSSPGHVEL